MSTRLGYGSTMSASLKTRVYEVLIAHPAAGQASRAVAALITVLIALNVLAVVLETVPSLHARYGGAFYAFEVFSVAVFTVEYVLRLWTCALDPRFAGPVTGRLRFAVTPMAVVDLMAVAPFYLPMVSADLRFLRATRLFRLLRVLKLGRYSESLRIFGNVLRARRADLIVALFAALLLLVFASAFMYFVERDAQPQAFSSIPATMWWGVVTLTTVGYGDVYPLTPVGRVLGAVIALFGVGLFALPAGILASGFAEEIQKKPGTRATCPHCGREIGGA